MRDMVEMKKVWKPNLKCVLKVDHTNNGFVYYGVISGFDEGRKASLVGRLL